MRCKENRKFVLIIMIITAELCDCEEMLFWPDGSINKQLETGEEQRNEQIKSLLVEYLNTVNELATANKLLSEEIKRIGYIIAAGMTNYINEVRNDDYSTNYHIIWQVLNKKLSKLKSDLICSISETKLMLMKNEITKEKAPSVLRHLCIIKNFTK